MRLQAEWDAQIDSLDQKREIHKIQMRLFKEQTATFLHDLNALRQEVVALKGHHDSEQRELRHTQSLLCSRVTDLERDLPSHRDELKELRVQVLGVESNLSPHLRELRRMLDRETETRDTFEPRMTELSECVAKHAQLHMEHDRSLKDLVATLGDSTQKHEAKLDQMQGRLTACERQGAHLGDLQKAHSSLANEKAALDMHYAALKERVEYLDGLLSSSADKHSRELEAIKSAHAKLASETKEHHGKFADILAEEKDARGAHHLSVQERLAFLENLLGESADKHDQHLSALEAHKGFHAKLTSEMESLKRAHESHLKGKDSLDKHHASVSERLEYIETLLGDSAEKHTRELEALKAAHAKLTKERDGVASHQGSLNQRVELLEKALSDAVDKHATELEQIRGAHGKHAKELEGFKGAHARHASMVERLEYVEKLLGDAVEKHATELEEIRGAHGKHAKELEGFKGAHARHASMAERLEYLEKLLGDSAEQHATELAAAHSKLDSLHGRLAEERAAREQHHNSMRSSMTAEQQARDAHHASVQERLQYLEGLIGDNADKHAKELESQRANHAKLTSEAKSREMRHATLEERLDFIERAISDSADKHAEELAAARTKVDQLHSSLKDVRDSHQATLKERVDYLENLLGDSADKHDQHVNALEAQKGFYAKLTSDIEGLKRAQESQSRGQSELDEQRISVSHRLDYVERLLRDSADKQARDSEAQRAAQSRLASELQARETQRAGMAERLDSLERLSGDTAENSRCKLADIHSRLLSCEKQQAQPSGLQSRLDVLEQRLGDDLADMRGRLQIEAQAREHQLTSQQAGRKDLQEMVLQERAQREQQLTAFQEALSQERSSQRSLEDVIAQWKVEGGRDKELFAERVDSLQRTMNVFDSLVRKEMDERSQESRRIWDAIDNHTHELSTEVMEVERPAVTYAAPMAKEAEGPRVVVPSARIVQSASALMPASPTPLAGSARARMYYPSQVATTRGEPIASANTMATSVSVPLLRQAAETWPPASVRLLSPEQQWRQVGSGTIS